MSRNSSAYLQYQRSAGEVTIQEAERKQRGTHENEELRANFSTRSVPRELLLPSSRGVASTTATVRRKIAPSLFLLHDLLTLERSRGNDKRSEEGIVLGEYKFGKLDRSSFAGKLAFEANVLVLRNEYLDFRYVGYFWTNKIIEKKFFRVWNI